MTEVKVPGGTFQIVAKNTPPRINISSGCGSMGVPTPNPISTTDYADIARDDELHFEMGQS